MGPARKLYARWTLLEIDRAAFRNNLVENAIRPVAIGRKKRSVAPYLFAGTHESAQRNAIMYTFMADCKKHDVNPETWLNHVLEKIPSASIKELANLLPENFRNLDGDN
ncbi:transposase domain-containing protein [Dyadobacter jejuensis]|uniref:transposase domain-containing protein n=1 Tax=Dyadobacter jejuensis TaxID=1082580 RepID=UPI000D6DA659